MTDSDHRISVEELDALERRANMVDREYSYPINRVDLLRLIAAARASSGWREDAKHDLAYAEGVMAGYNKGVDEDDSVLVSAEKMRADALEVLKSPSQSGEEQEKEDGNRPRIRMGRRDGETAEAARGYADASDIGGHRDAAAGGTREVAEGNQETRREAVPVAPAQPGEEEPTPCVCQYTDRWGWWCSAHNKRAYKATSGRIVCNPDQPSLPLDIAGMKERLERKCPCPGYPEKALCDCECCSALRAIGQLEREKAEYKNRWKVISDHLERAADENDALDTKLTEATALNQRLENELNEWRAKACIDK